MIWSKVRLSLLSLSFLVDAYGSEAAPAFDDISFRLLLRLPFCQAAKKYHVTPEVLAGVYLYENQINRGVKDTLEDVVFRLLLENTDDVWWTHWAERAMKLASSAERVRLFSNKWPTEVMITGLVVSIGPAQITPRTALRACEALPEASICSHGVKPLIAGLLDEGTSVDVAAAVLRFEADEHLRLTGEDISVDPGRWAMVYNVGGEYFRKTYKFGHATSVNKFGQWVGERESAIREVLHCSI